MYAKLLSNYLGSNNPLDSILASILSAAKEGRCNTRDLEDGVVCLAVLAANLGHTS